MVKPLSVTEESGLVLGAPQECVMAFLQSVTLADESSAIAGVQNSQPDQSKHQGFPRKAVFLI